MRHYNEKASAKREAICIVQRKMLKACRMYFSEYFEEKKT